MRILLVEDDLALARGLTTALRQDGFEVDHVVDGNDALQLVKSEPYRAIALDLGLPGLSGLSLLKYIRSAGLKVPVIILTARDTVADRIQGLDLGADDYLSKPFDLGEFEARVRALVRRGLGQPAPLLRCGTLTLDLTTRTVSLAEHLLMLRPREYAVLSVLITRAGQVVSKERIGAEVFGIEAAVAPNALELYIARLRRKLGDKGPLIRTIHGLGYLLDCSTQPSPSATERR